MAQPNSFTTADWVAMQGLRLLTNKLVVAQFGNTDYNKEFTKPFAIGDTVTVKFPQRYTIRTGMGYDPQPLNRPTTTITMDQVFGLDFEYNDLEQALSLERGKEDFKKSYLEPATAQIAQEIDSRFTLFAYQNTPNITGVLGTNPTTLDSVSGAARQRMIELACPPGGERGMIVSPAVERAMVAAGVAVFNPASEISRQYKEGSMGKQGGFDWYASMSLYNHTAGSLTATPTVSGANQSGSTITLAATSGDTLKKGDVISFDNVYAVNPMTRRRTTVATDKQFVVTADVTWTASTADVPIYPAIVGPGSQYQNVDALPANAATVTLFPGTSSPNGLAGINGLALHRDAFALVGVDLEVPKAVEMASVARDPETGIGFRFVRAWDPIQSKTINRYDVVLGFGVLYADACAVRVLGA